MSHEPIVEVRIHLKFAGDGFEVWSRHRHYGGLFTDCEEIVCSRMTLEDALDVMACLGAESGPHGLGAAERLS